MSDYYLRVRYMHYECRFFMESTKQNFPQFFKNCKVLDVGSQDINGTNKYLFTNCDYIGLDLGPGKNVDVISHVKDYDPGYQFDTIISTNAFEQDKHFTESMDAICKRLLKSGGVFIFSAATDGTPEHGTTLHHAGHSPHTNDFYKNIHECDVYEAMDIDSIFGIYTLNIVGCDIRFFGIKK